jgi:hypothetical protein
MKNNKTTQNPMNTNEQITEIDAIALDNVTGGCAACGGACSTAGMAMPLATTASSRRLRR